MATSEKKTVNITEELHTELKIRAAKRKKSIQEELELILKKELAKNK